MLQLPEVQALSSLTPDGRLLFATRMVLGKLEEAGVLVSVLAVYGWVLAQGWGEAETRMIGFAGLVLADLALILANPSRSRSAAAAALRSPNPALWWVSVGALAFLALALFVPFLRGLFSFAPLHAGEVGLILLTGLVSLLVAESVKTRPWQRLLAPLERRKQSE